MAFLIDSNVLSETSRPKPSPKVLDWMEAQDAELRMSAITIGELIKGIRLMDGGRRRDQIENWFQRIEIWSRGRVISLDESTMRLWGALYAKYQKAGLKLNLMDSLIAATALEHQLTLVTRNESDFPDEVTVFNPWK
jgi:predicted nucleic acid-binding protein